MKLLAIAVLAVLPAAFAAGNYTITAYTSDYCDPNSAIVETVSGTTSSTCITFPQGRSLDLIMYGSCDRMTAYWSSDCTPNVGPPPDQTDPGSPYNVGCQTFALNDGETSSFNSFEVFC